MALDTHTASELETRPSQIMTGIHSLWYLIIDMNSAINDGK